ncbi:putative Ig domain-containing protein [Pontiella sulfatireligans]|uniref:Bacterial repeat domain-containing protein n=1 Tax=Pontiella sulfatireligans TaxID=2750658 RepID=A0A6C2UL68_9BACT|nr:putative Ig domain-containing protein [Pontiella sulfatireligans]VGO20709.1 hypothetical protein SCARR_02776 [Pontiella sulfatireligans]
MRFVLNSTVYLIICVFVTLKAEGELGLARESYGVWDRSAAFTVAEYPFTRGREYSANWVDINPARSNFTWSALDVVLQEAYDQNQKFFIKIQPIAGSTGTSMPPWMLDPLGPLPSGYDPNVVDGTVPSCTDGQFIYGYYLDADLQIYLSEMVQSLADHVRNDIPPHLQDIIGFVRVDTAHTGDEAPYEEPQIIAADYPDYVISDSQWLTYRTNIFEAYRAAFQDGPGPKIPLLFQDIEVSKFPNEWNWVTNNVTAGFGAKYAGLVRGHHLSRSQDVTDTFKEHAVDSDLGLFSRNEMDGTWDWPFFQLNYRLSMYWCAVEQLHPGLSVWDVTKNCLETAYTSNIVFAFEFFNTWAAELDPPTARGGFCILHEGLDSSDIVKFPEGIYGNASQSNTNRYIAICASNAAHGAQMDDPYAATRGQVWQRPNQTGFNDSGWEIVSGNYERFITQIDPDATSIGRFRINGPLTTASHPYDRFARSFDSANGKNTMYFDLHDELLPNPGQRLQLSVIYLDRGTGQFELQYDAVGDSGKTAFTVTKTGSNTWKTNSVIVTDWVCGNNGPNGADLMLLNVDADDDIFHMLEVVKLAYVNIGTVGQGTVSARNDGMVYSDPVSTTLSEGLMLELKPSPALGWEFTGWSGDLSGTNNRPFLFPTEDTRVTANFAFVPGSASATDDFESGDWNGGSGWDGDWTAVPTATPGSIVQLNVAGSITRSLDSPLTNATLSFDWDVDRIVTGEAGQAWVFNGTWHLVWSENIKGGDSGSSPELASTNINLSAYGSISQVRFELTGNQTTDRFWIDNVQVTGAVDVGANQPMFSSDPITNSAASIGDSCSGSVADQASDPNSDPMIFSIVSGAAWLNMATNGTLSGTPGPGDSGLNNWIIQVADDVDGSDSAILLIDVGSSGSSSNTAPYFTTDPINTPNAEDNAAYSGTLAGAAKDDDVGDMLSYSRISGPDWLVVAADGALSGTPDRTDVGTNTFMIKVEDNALASDTATLKIMVDPTAGGGLASDDFESGTWTGGTGWAVGWSTNGGAVVETDNDLNSIAAHLTKNGQITRTLDPPQVDSRLTFDWKLKSLDNPSEYAQAEVYDGAWHIVWTNTSVVLMLGAEDIDLGSYGAVSQVRFTVFAGGVADHFHIDNLVVSGSAPAPYSVWSNQYSLVQGPAGNDDGDALNNLYEFGLGGNPTNPSDLGYLPTLGKMSGGGSNWFEYIHVRQTDPDSGLLYYLELSDNLASNLWTTNGYTVVGSGSFTNGFDAVTNRISTETKDEQFIRLIIESL